MNSAEWCTRVGCRLARGHDGDHEVRTVTTPLAEPFTVPATGYYLSPSQVGPATKSRQPRPVEVWSPGGVLPNYRNAWGGALWQGDSMPRIVVVRLPGWRWRRWCAFTLNDLNEPGRPHMAHNKSVAQLKAATG